MSLIIAIVFAFFAYLVFCDIEKIDFNDMEYADIGDILVFSMLLIGICIMITL